jgi:uncharacterized protein YndB with AHSA1/START domain
MDKHTTVHAEFTLSRNLQAPVAKVYQMFADKQSKEQWFKAPNSKGEHTMDFRVGGSELNSGKFHGGVTHVFKAHYYDIIPEVRIVYAYEMYLDGKRISVSIATIEFVPEGNGTKLVLHESGTYLDELDKPESREAGTHYLLDAIEKAVNTKEGE